MCVWEYCALLERESVCELASVSVFVVRKIPHTLNMLWACVGVFSMRVCFVFLSHREHKWCFQMREDRGVPDLGQSNAGWVGRIFDGCRRFDFGCESKPLHTFIHTRPLKYVRLPIRSCWRCRMIIIYEYVKLENIYRWIEGMIDITVASVLSSDRKSGDKFSV